MKVLKLLKALSNYCLMLGYVEIMQEIGRTMSTSSSIVDGSTVLTWKN